MGPRIAVRDAEAKKLHVHADQVPPFPEATQHKRQKGFDDHAKGLHLGHIDSR